MIEVAKFLSSPVSHYAYDWIAGGLNLRKIDKGTLLDVGTRTSGWAAFMSSIGFDVTSVERDKAFLKDQAGYQKRFNTFFPTFTGDLLDLPNNERFDIITAVFSLQHNIDKDIECYEKCARICDGLLYIVNEYNYYDDDFQRGRSDGDLRRYSRRAIEERIINPIDKIRPFALATDYFKFTFPEHEVWKCGAKEANVIMMELDF